VKMAGYNIKQGRKLLQATAREYRKFEKMWRRPSTESWGKTSLSIYTSSMVTSSSTPTN
jgi:hypothetical protein